jgi:hypothetical protein
MFKKIYFDHVNCEDKNHKFINTLENKGFTLSADEVEHPGKRHCRFIMFVDKNNSKFNYLEFINVGNGGVSHRRVGLSFGYRVELKKLYQSVSKKISSNFIHKNYQWKVNSKDSLPGWNFLTFKNTGMRNIYTWFTEYEPDPARLKKQKLKTTKHPNSVYEVHGIEMSLSKKGKESFGTILGRKLASVNTMKDGTTLYVKEGNTNRCERVILRCKDFKKAQKLIRPDEEIEFMGEPALLIRNNSNGQHGWDLVVINI